MTSREDIPLLLNTRKPSGIGAVLAIAFAALVLVWIGIPMQVGNMIADLTSASEPQAGDAARYARWLSPGDPIASWLDSSVEAEIVSDDSLGRSIEGFKRTVRLSPHNYVWWIDLGRTLGQSGSPQAEKSFRQAVELAPNYTVPRWQLGNFYLRSGDEESAFRELRLAAEGDAVYREQVFSVAWDYFGKDVEKLEAVAGGSPEMRVGLARFYAARSLPEKSVETWRSLPPEVRDSNAAVGSIILQWLFEKRFLRSAVEFSKLLGAEKGAGFEEIENAGFEDPISDDTNAFFGWQFRDEDGLRIQMSRTMKRSGTGSLRASFTGYDAPDLGNISKTIALAPGASYRINFWLRTEELSGVGTPKIEVLNAGDNTLLASSDPFPAGTSDWREVEVEFTVPEGTDGVVLRTSRAYCGDKCPIFGTVWYDDFEIRRLSGPKNQNG